jgi:hypothetical protein
MQLAKAPKGTKRASPSEVDTKKKKAKLEEATSLTRSAARRSGKTTTSTTSKRPITRNPKRAIKQDETKDVPKD